MFGQCVLCPTWCCHFCTVKTGVLFWAPLRTSGVKVLFVTGKISWWHFSKGLIKTQLGKYLLFTLSRGKSLSHSLASDIALSRMARRPSAMALEVWHQEMRSQVLYPMPTELVQLCHSRKAFSLSFLIPLENNKNGTESQVNLRNTNPCSFRHLSTEEKGMK